MDINVEIKNKGISIPEEVINVAGDSLIAKIFFNRGYKDSRIIQQMLDEKLYIPTESNEFKDMDQVVKYIIDAFEKNKKICIYGDYDVDGVTSTVVLYECFSNYTKNLIYHVPDRFKEGYGMNKGVIENLAKEKVDLIVTCDCGISNVDEVKLAIDLGMEVIITDHHKVGDKLPEALYILNPNLLEPGHKASHISGCAMAYFVAKEIYLQKGDEHKEEALLDMVGLSLIADVVSLNGENRYLLKKSLKVIAETNRLGLIELFNIIEKEPRDVNEEDIGFGIAPRINAAGRMDSARLPVDLFLSKDLEFVKETAQQVDFLNKERKRIQEEMIIEALDYVEKRKKNKTIIVVYNEYWHHGIIGIGAGKVCETYRKPTIFLSLKEDGETIVGSARSIEEINIYNLIKEVSEHLEKFGGHSQAAGLSLKKGNLRNFVNAIEEAAESKYFLNDEVTVEVDEEIDVSVINEETFDRIQKAGPYGEGFEMPSFYTKKLYIVSDRKLKNNHHIMVVADENDNRISAVKWFGLDEHLEGKTFDFIFRITKNTYKGNDEIRMSVEHMIKSSGEKTKLFKGAIIDETNTEIQELKSKYGDANFFYEGLPKKDLSSNTVNRMSIKANKTLVLLGIPQSIDLLKEAVAISNPKQLVISLKYNSDYNFKTYIMNFLGLVKHVISKEYGKSNLEVFSSILCVEETIILTTLKLMKAYGKLDYDILSDNYTFIVYNNKVLEKTNTVVLERSLKSALLEKEAYTKYIKKSRVKDFYKYLV
jgi:single-stranded-DNA-specific exonuclease